MNKQYNVTITETLQRTITIEAENEQEAEMQVTDKYYNGDIVLDSSDFVKVTFDSERIL